MLAGIYYGAQYGGSTTAILINVPGEATSVVTTLDGHQMARQGRAGVALGTAAIVSFVAGTVSTVVVAALGVPLTKVALLFGPVEYFSLMVLGLAFAVVLARGSLLKAAAMILIGVLLSTIGTDLETGEERLTFGLAALASGIDFVVLAMGMFGFAEILRNLESPETRDVVKAKIGRLLPTKADIRQSVYPMLRGTALGAVAGHPARQRGGPRAVRLLCGGEKALEDAGTLRAGAPSRAWRGRKPPTTRARRPRSSRC